MTEATMKMLFSFIILVLSISAVAIPLAFVGAIAVHLTVDVAQAGWELVGNIIN